MRAISVVSSYEGLHDPPSSREFVLRLLPLHSFFFGVINPLGPRGPLSHPCSEGAVGP